MRRFHPAAPDRFTTTLDDPSLQTYGFPIVQTRNSGPTVSECNRRRGFNGDGLDAHLHRRERMAAAGIGAQQNPHSAAALRRQLQAPRGRGVQPADRRHHGRHGRTTQTLIDRPEHLFRSGNPNDQQPINLHPQPPHGRRIEIAPRIDDRDGPAPLCGGHGGAKGQRRRPYAVQGCKNLGDRPARQPAVRQGLIQSG